MGLAVIVQVVQTLAHYLHSLLILPRPHSQPQLRLQDAACPGPDGPAAVYSHSQAQHCPTMLIGKRWCVTPAPCGSLTSCSQSLPAWPWGSYPHSHSHKGLTREIHTGWTLSHHPLPRCRQLYWLHGDKVPGRHDSLADQDLPSPFIMASCSHQQGWPARREKRYLHGAPSWE